ncbi:uncharacterized protein LOC122260475 [Penaeus japonicus]|uniref:uncharacterized protein LOC122260475 n=1 Tax=Penaeus japonicus TaxID=27405 RepID=UPI001C714D19|nr:uncharacterized protein LOC122260475 [Penaeus japonicus]
MNWLILSVVLGLGCLSHARNEEDARIVARYETKTAFLFTTSTTTVPFTCISGDLATTPCSKRRLRRTAPIDDMNGNASGLLDSSIDMVDSQLMEESNRNQRIAMTFWSTLSSTYTLTSTSTNSATTFSVSFYCTVAGVAYPPACG